MRDLLQYAPAAAFYLLALAAQVSGITSLPVALALVAIATIFLMIPIWRQFFRIAPTAALTPPRPVLNAPVNVSAPKGHVRFDYSTQNGIVQVGEGDCKFGVHFSKASDTSIHLYKDSTNISRLARVKDAKAGQKIRFSDYDSTSRVYTVHTGEIFLLENAKGCYLQGRIVSIKDDSRGADRDEVVFDYEINADGSAEFTAL